MKLNRLFVSIGVMALAAACGGGGGGGSGNTTTNTQSATSTVQSTTQLQSSIGTMNGQSAGGALNSIGGSASSIVQPAAPSQGAAIAMMNDVIRELDLKTKEASALASNAPGDCLCDESGNCTFDQCGMGSGYEISGTITKSGDAYTIDVDSQLNYGGTDYMWHYEGTVTITAALIDGDLSGTGTGSIDVGEMHLTYDWDWEVHYNMLGIETCGASSGSLDASVSFSVSGVSGADAGNYSGDAHIEFAAGCVATAS